MSKLLISLTVSPIAVVVCSTFTPAIAGDPQFCDPLGRLVSGLEVDEDSELLCAGETLPIPDEDVTVTAVCFTSNEVEELEIKAGEAVSVFDVCHPEHSVVECGERVCFAPRGDVAQIAINIINNTAPLVTLLDWDDVPGSHQYFIQVLDGTDTIFSAQAAVSQVETDLLLDGDKTVSVTAISSSRFILGYGLLSTADEDEG